MVMSPTSSFRHQQRSIVPLSEGCDASVSRVVACPSFVGMVPTVGSGSVYSIALSMVGHVGGTPRGRSVWDLGLSSSLSLAPLDVRHSHRALRLGGSRCQRLGCETATTRPPGGSTSWVEAAMRSVRSHTHAVGKLSQSQRFGRVTRGMATAVRPGCAFFRSRCGPGRQSSPAQRVLLSQHSTLQQSGCLSTPLTGGLLRCSLAVPACLSYWR